jgi:photosystem II stability/assembly factor-like uncharacterized protein
MIKKIYATLTAFFVLLALDHSDSCAQITWVKQDPPTNRILSSCSFLNFNTGWISGDSGLILKTTNAGLNWVQQNSGTYLNIDRIFFLNQQLGYALAWNIFPDTNEFMGTMILKTTNGGDLWTRSFYPDTNRFLRDIFFINPSTGFVGGSPLLIAKTTNSGANWITTDADTLNIGLPVFAIRFYDALTGYASGGFRDIAGAMWRTTNGGMKWFSEIVGPEPLVDLSIITPQKAIAVGGDFEFGSSYVKTTNAGINWAYDTLGVFGVAWAIDYRTPQEIWLSLGTSQKFAYSLDGGVTWANRYTPDSVIVTDIDFTDTLHGWAVGYFGAVLKYDGTMSSVNSNQLTDQPYEFALEQNFPNPFNPVTAIKFYLNNDGDISMNVFDASGKFIKNLANGHRRSGQYEVSFDGSSLPSGVYFCNMEFSSPGYASNKTIKLILLK